MRVVSRYKTKSKWPLFLDAKGLPILGYEGHAYNAAISETEGRENLLLHGTLMLVGTSRGRSAASMLLQSLDGWEGHSTLSGAEEMFRAVADGRLGIQQDTWTIPTYSGTEVCTAPVLRGFWTVSKQGQNYSLIPAPSNIIPTSGVILVDNDSE